MLLARRTKPPFQWSLPGGRLEPGESAAQAAIREAQEEVSLEIEILEKSGEREVEFPDQNLRYVISVFAARLVAGEPQTGAEASETGWFAPEEIASLDTSDGLAEALREAAAVFLARKA